ncbi:MAG: hypothetical protein AB7P67_09585 [Vicinamibacterales bacterium]
MKTSARKDITRIIREDSKSVDDAMTRGVREALLRHKQAGQPVVISRNGTITLLKPDEIEP